MGGGGNFVHTIISAIYAAEDVELLAAVVKLEHWGTNTHPL